MAAKASGPGQILKKCGVEKETETDLLAQERAGKRASPRVEAQRRAGSGVTARKQQSSNTNRKQDRW